MLAPVETTMKDQYLGRRDRLRRLLNRSAAGAILVTNPVNVTYLTGFTGEDSYLLVGQAGDVLLSDFRYSTQLEEECPGLELANQRQDMTMTELTATTVGTAKLRQLALEAESINWSLLETIREKIKRIETVATSGLVERLREVKDKTEIGALRASIAAAEKAFGVLRATLRPEKTEIELRNELEYQIRLFGAEDRGFPSIVAAGPRAALPHAAPSNARIGDSDFVLVDWGARGTLYRCDLTRVLVTGRISPKLERVYGVVLNAQLRAIEAVRPGIPASEIDQIARRVIGDAGFGRYFGHGLGHGIGLDIHERPRLASTNSTPLKPGMVMTVEPGVYIPGWGGVRIEDDILVTRKGHEVLTSVPKELDAVVVS